MLERTPDYNLGNLPPHQTTTYVDLAPVVISPSSLLYRLEVFVYLAMLLSASAAIFPFLLTAFYWPLLWLAFSLMTAVAIGASLRKKNAEPVTLSVTQTIWHLQTQQGHTLVKPCNEIVMWTKLIILPVKEITNGRKHRLVALPDSMTAEDWRRLRVWLGVALHKKT